jgi:hypothetical protein
VYGERLPLWVKFLKLTVKIRNPLWVKFLKLTVKIRNRENIFEKIFEIDRENPTFFRKRPLPFQNPGDAPERLL